MGIYEQLGLKRVVNATGTITMLGGSLMERETIEAMNEAAKDFVFMEKLIAKAGEVIAETTGSEAGLVTSGCCASLVIAAAACMTGKDPVKIASLPDATGMNNEVIIQRMHRNGYDHCLKYAGIKYVEIGTRNHTSAREMEAAINQKTAAVAYFAFDPQEGVLPLREVIKIAHKQEVPVIVDAAAELPPQENLKKYIEMGADMVAFSGGKQILGPNDTGILCGKKDLIEAARLHAFPGYFVGRTVIGRPMKVSKEQIVGLIVALQRFVEKDYEAEMERWTRMAEYMAKELDALPDIKAEVGTPDSGTRPLAIPRALIAIDERGLGMTIEEVAEKMKKGDPPVRVYPGPVKGTMHLNPQCLREGQEKIVIKRLKEVLIEKR